MRSIDRRVGWLFLIFLAALAIALVRTLWLGGVQSGTLKREAFAQQVTNEAVPAQRGEITDTDGTPLALSESVDDVDADPYLINAAGDANAMAKRIAPLLHMAVLTVTADLTKPKTGWSPIATQVSPSVARKILDLTVGGKPINGIYTEPDTKRVYPRSWELSQVLGFVNDTGNGASGIEAEYNNALKGTSGERKVINNPNTGDPISIQNTKAVKNGKAVQLTVSAPLQAEVEQVLAGVGAEYKPKLATAIVMNPRNGAILALGNWPRVNDNNPYGSGATKTEMDNAIQDHAVSFTYEPGSTFKAVTVAGAMQDGLITPSTVFDVPPYLEAYGTKISDAEPHGYEHYTTADILKVSSNIGADLIGQKLGPDRFNYWVHRFGLGKSTGSGLPGEDDGFILSPKHYSGLSMYNLPFGQGESVTPLQMADVYSTIANGGTLRSPHIVKAVGGKAVATPKGHRIISSSTASEIRNMLRGVVGDGGTASGAAIQGYDLAGKTGTANIAIDGKYSSTEYVASFIGMVPAADPKLVVAVVVDEPQGNIYGGSVAGPAFQKIVGWAVPYFGINPNPAGIKTSP